MSKERLDWEVPRLHCEEVLDNMTKWVRAVTEHGRMTSIHFVYAKATRGWDHLPLAVALASRL